MGMRLVRSLTSPLLRKAPVSHFGQNSQNCDLKLKNHCKSAIFSSILPPNGLFLMDTRWHCCFISIGCLLHPKKWVFGFKRGKFWNFQNSRPSSLLRLWRPYYASPRPGRCLWAERTSRRWFWVLNGLCATSGSRDMGRQSFLEENQNFKKMHFYHLSPS